MAIVRAKQAFAYFHKGVSRIVKPGDLFHDSDPAVKGREKLFEPVESKLRGDARVESATAEPGALRSLGRPRRKAVDSTDSVTQQDD